MQRQISVQRSTDRYLADDRPPYSRPLPSGVRWYPWIPQYWMQLDGVLSCVKGALVPREAPDSVVVLANRQREPPWAGLH